MYQWTNITQQAAFAPRDGAGGLVFNDKMWLLGGWNPDDKVNFPHICNSEIWSSSNGTDWNLEVRQAPWEGRHYGGYVVHDGHMWIIGGDANQGHYQNDIWNSADGIQWEPVADTVPWGPRVLQHTVVFDGYIWVMGGQTLPQFAPAPELLYGDVWRSRDGISWERVLDHAPWSPRGLIGGSAVFQDRMWIIGGGTYQMPTHQRIYYNDVWSSADGRDWRQHTAAAAWSPRQFHEVAAFDGRLWVLEGCDRNGNFRDSWHSANGVDWMQLPQSPWAARHAASLYIYHDALWMVAGNNMTSDVWRLSRVP
jgi:hypothetical protein